MRVWSFGGGSWRDGDDPGAELRWFDLQGPGEGALEELAARFGLHPLAVEDCLSPRMHAPKIDDFGSYLFVVAQALVARDGEEALEELDVFLFREALITYRDRPIASITEVHGELERGMAVRPGADGLLYEILDRTIDAILPAVEDLAEALDAIHERVLDDPGGEPPGHAVVTLRARAGHIRRVMTPQLAVVQRLSRGEFGFVAEANRVYYRDIADHLVRIDMGLERVREDAEVVLSTYLSTLNNRLSEVMKVLAVIAALALPASVISGIFGTNFDNVPGLHSNWGFGVMIGAMAALAGGMALYFRRKGWF